MPLYDVAVVIINYNSSEFTLNCVASLYEKTSATVKFQVIVIDNNSKEEHYRPLLSLKGLPDLQLFRSRINGGFSAGNMLGVQFAQARYYYFLNNDTVLLNDVMSILLAYMDAQPKVGISSGQMYDKHGKHYLNFNYLPSLGLKLFGVGFMRLFRFYPSRRKVYTEPLEVEILNGSSMFVRAEVFDKIGGFDTNLFLYCEEEDLARRLRKEGYRAHLVPQARYQHFISQSTNPDSRPNMVLLKEFYISFLYYFRKHHSYFYAKAMQGFLIFKFLKKPRYWEMVVFLFRGAQLKDSLRFKQSLGQKFDQ
jgi:GT2 family glycosyltransferase